MLAPLRQLYRQTVRPGKEALLPRLALSLPGKTTVFPRQVPLLFPGKLAPLLATAVLPVEGSSSSQATALIPSVEGSSSPNSLSSTQAGQINNPTSSFRQGYRCPPGTGPPRPPRRSIPPPGKATLPPPPLLGLPRILLMKNLTLSGSSTSPTNLWPQLKGLFWLKDPTLWLPPGSLLT